MHWVDQITHFYYLNLRKRSDRKAQIDQVLGALNVPPGKITRIEALEHNEGFTGCTLSHLQALKKARTQRHKYVCILEDDFMLHVPPNVFHQHVNYSWTHLKGKFDIMFLAMTPIELVPIPPHSRLQRVKKALAMPAYVVHQKYLPQLIHIMELALLRHVPHDMVTQEYQSFSQWYGFYPVIGRQRPGFSDIEQKEVNYTYLDVDGRMLQRQKKKSGTSWWRKLFNWRG